MGIEPTSSAWKAEVLPFNYTRDTQTLSQDVSFGAFLVEGEGFEPSKAEPSDLQSDPFGRSGTPPEIRTRYSPQALDGCQPFIFTHPLKSTFHLGAGDRNRTRGLLITNQLLYQLSYASEDPAETFYRA